MKPNDITAEVRQELADDIARMKALAERDDDLAYAVQNDQDDTGKRETIWISCGCSYCRRTQEVKECAMHREMSQELI